MPTVCETLIATKVKLENDIQNSYLPAFTSAESAAAAAIKDFYKDFGQYRCGENVYRGDSLLPGFKTGETLNSSYCQGGSFNCSQDGCKNRINNTVNPALNKYASAYSQLENSRKALVSANAQIAANAGCKEESIAASKEKAGKGFLYAAIAIAVITAAVVLVIVIRKRIKS